VPAARDTSFGHIQHRRTYVSGLRDLRERVIARMLMLRQALQAVHEEQPAKDQRGEQ
jgi:hypothetical protein